MPTASEQGACPGIWVRLSLVEIYLTGITWSHFQRTVWTLHSNKGKESVMVTNDTSWYASELREKLEVYPNYFTRQIGSLNNHEVDVKNVLGAKQLHTYTKSSQVKSTLFRQVSPISHWQVSKVALHKLWLQNKGYHEATKYNTLLPNRNQTRQLRQPFTTQMIIRCKLFFLFIGPKPSTWLANCPQIMVCSCAMSSNWVWLQIIFCSCVNETTLFSSYVKNGRSLRFPKISIKIER